MLKSVLKQAGHSRSSQSPKYSVSQCLQNNISGGLRYSNSAVSSMLPSLNTEKAKSRAPTSTPLNCPISKTILDIQDRWFDLAASSTIRTIFRAIAASCMILSLGLASKYFSLRQSHHGFHIDPPEQRIIVGEYLGRILSQNHVQRSLWTPGNTLATAYAIGKIDR